MAKDTALALNTTGRVTNCTKEGGGMANNVIECKKTKK